MSINLLPNEAKFLANRIKFRKQVLSLTYVMVGAWAVGMIVIYSVWLIFRQIYVADNKKLEVAQNNYAKLSSNIITNQKLRYRVKLVNSILDQRYEYAKAFRTIMTLFAQPVVIDRFELQKDGSFSVEGKVETHTVMDEVEKKVLDINKGLSADFASATINRLSVDGKLWEFSMNVTIK